MTLHTFRGTKIATVKVAVATSSHRSSAVFTTNSRVNLATVSPKVPEENLHKVDEDHDTDANHHTDAEKGRSGRGRANERRCKNRGGGHARKSAVCSSTR